MLREWLHIFLDFTTYLGTFRAALMVVVWFLGEWAIKTLPVTLAKKDSKLAKQLVKNIGKNKEMPMY